MLLAFVFIVYRLLVALNMFLHIKKQLPWNFALTLDQVRYIAYRLVVALAFLHHHGIVHSDLTPWNSMLPLDFPTDFESAGGDVRRVHAKQFAIVLSDVGSMHRLADFGPGGTAGRVVTTQEYRAPEILFGRFLGARMARWLVSCVCSQKKNSRGAINLREIIRTISFGPDRLRVERNDSLR